MTEISVLDVHGGHWRQKEGGKLRKHHGKKDSQHGQKLTQEIPPMQKEHEKNKVGIGDYQAKGGIARQRDIGQKAGYGVQDENQRIIETRRELGGKKPAEGAIPHRLLSEIHQQIGKYIQGCSGHGGVAPSNMVCNIALWIYITGILQEMQVYNTTRNLNDIIRTSENGLRLEWLSIFHYN